MPTAPAPPVTRALYRRFLPIPTRWMDNDVYGHVNNVVYYAYFDTVINQYLIEEGGLDIAAGSVIGLCVESHCAYTRPVAFPDVLDAGLRVERALRDRHLRARRGRGERARLVRARLRGPRDAQTCAASRPDARRAGAHPRAGQGVTPYFAVRAGTRYSSTVRSQL
jgi:acyl-CoA thioesterase FadM